MLIQYSISIFREFATIKIKDVIHFHKYENGELIEVGKAKILNQIPEIPDCDLINIKEKVAKNFLERKIVFAKPKIKYHRKDYKNSRKNFCTSSNRRF